MDIVLWTGQGLNGLDMKTTKDWLRRLSVIELGLVPSTVGYFQVNAPSLSMWES